ncbi:MAG: DUF6516 family protein [Desulfobacteraceae bacterium]
MNELMEQIFRYDNAPHHSNINTFPHYKHEKEEIKESGEPTLSDILTAIARIQRKQQNTAGYPGAELGRNRNVSGWICRHAGQTKNGLPCGRPVVFQPDKKMQQIICPG